MIEDPELFRLFKAESEEHLARLDDGLLRLEKTPADPALLEEVFRESHSLKGAARMLGLARVETASHALESILNAARRGEAPLTPETIAHMNAGRVDLYRGVQEALADAPPAAAVPPAATLAAMAENLIGSESPAQALQPPEPSVTPPATAPAAARPR